MNNNEDEKQRIFSEVVSHYIYVKPDAFKFLQTLNIALPITAEEIDISKHYFIWTKKFHSTNKGMLHLVTDQETAFALKTLLRNDVQYMFPDKKGVPFDAEESILTIHGIPIPIRRGDMGYLLCKQLFANMESIEREWELETFIEESGIYEDPPLDLDIYEYLRSSVRHINKRVNKLAGIEKLINLNASTIKVNPTYIPIFQN